VFYEPRSRDRQLLPHDPVKAIVAPRPIGWISTRALDGRVNLAPYSFFNAFSGAPPIVGFSSDGLKDSASFAKETGEFAYNLASFELLQAVSKTSAPLPRGTSEFDHAGLTMAPCRLIKAPRVAEAHAAFECKVVHFMQLKDSRGQPVDNFLVIGEVVGVHIDDAYIVNGRFDTAKARPLARLGYKDYSAVERTFELARPAGGGDGA
jgi:flavin reductase (DIM6/NTAB) family NADH-FMN oxidoreductase RutF